MLLSNFTPKNAKHIDPDYILLCTFGWRVFGKLSENETKAVCEHISMNGPAVEPCYSLEPRRFTLGQITVYMPTFADGLIFAGVEEVILQAHGYKCEEVSFTDFFDSLERPLRCMYTPRFDIGYNCQSPAGIPLFTMPHSAGKTFRLFLRRDVGSVEYLVDAPDPNVSVRIVVYQRVVHMAKMFYKNYESIPKSHVGVRSRVQACALAWHKYRELDVEKLSGYRVEVTVAGHITLGRAREIVRYLLPARVVPSCVVTSGHISVQDYLAQADETIKVALCELRGCSGRDLTRNDRIVVARMYNALGLWSRRWIGHVVLTQRVGKYYRMPIKTGTISPTIPITSSESFFHWEEMIRAEALLRTGPIDPNARRHRSKSVFGILAWGRNTKGFRDKRELAHWAVSQYGREWPRYLRHNPPRNPPPADQPQVSCSPDQLPTPDGHHLPASTGGTSRQVLCVRAGDCTEDDEVSQAEKLLYTRRPIRCTKEGWVCSVKKADGAITPAFPSKRDLAHWAVSTFGKEWHHHLKVTSLPPSRPSSSHSESLSGSPPPSPTPVNAPPSPLPPHPATGSPLPSPMPVNAPPSSLPPHPATGSPLPSPVPPPSPLPPSSPWLAFPDPRAIRSPLPHAFPLPVSVPLPSPSSPSLGSSGTPSILSDPFASPPPLSPHTSRSPSPSDVCMSPPSPLVDACIASPPAHMHSHNVHASPVVGPTQLPQSAPVNRDLEIEEAEAILYTRRHMHPKKRDKICAVKRNGSCTKAFATRREVAVWAVNRYKSGEWKEELKLLVQPNSPTPSTPAWQTAPFRLTHTTTTATGTSCTSPPTPTVSPLHVTPTPPLVPLAAPPQQVQTSQEAPLTQAGTTALTLSTQLQTCAPVPCITRNTVPSQSLSSSQPPSQASEVAPHHELSDGDIVLINNRHHRIRSMRGDGNCFFSAVSEVMTSTPRMRGNVSATALRQETIRYYRNAPASELTLIEDVVFYTESASLRDRADDLSTHRSNSRSHWGSLVELYVLAVITGISFRHGYWYSPLEGVHTTTIHPLFTNLPPEVTRSVILFAHNHYYVAEPTDTK